MSSMSLTNIEMNPRDYSSSKRFMARERFGSFRPSEAHSRSSAKPIRRARRSLCVLRTAGEDRAAARPASTWILGNPRL